MNELTEETITSENIYQGSIVNLRRDTVKLPNGKQGKREVVEHSGGVVILPYQADKVILVEQFRKPAEDTILEVPAGRLEPEESPEKCAQRELEEETGYQAGKVEKVYDFYPSPGYTNELLHLYLATDLKKHEQNLDENEFVRLRELSVSELKTKLKQGAIKDAKTIIAAQYLLLNFAEELR